MSKITARGEKMSRLYIPFGIFTKYKTTCACFLYCECPGFMVVMFCRNLLTSWASRSWRPVPRMRPTLSRRSWPWQLKSRSGWDPRPRWLTRLGRARRSTPAPAPSNRPAAGAVKGCKREIPSIQWLAFIFQQWVK